MVRTTSSSPKEDEARQAVRQKHSHTHTTHTRARTEERKEIQERREKREREERQTDRQTETETDRELDRETERYSLCLWCVLSVVVVSVYCWCLEYTDRDRERHTERQNEGMWTGCVGHTQAGDGGVEVNRWFHVADFTCIPQTRQPV